MRGRSCHLIPEITIVPERLEHTSTMLFCDIKCNIPLLFGPTVALR